MPWAHQAVIVARTSDRVVDNHGMRDLRFVERLRQRIHEATRRTGFDLVRYRPLRFPELRRARIFEHRGIDLVLDIGANDGAYGLELRASGFAGRILSFEPQQAAFDRLATRAAKDPAWECTRVAIGSRDDEHVFLNIAANSSSSSLLAMSARHVASAPESRYVGRESVRLTRLDAVAGDAVAEHRHVCLKVDVQGLELDVLAGAADTLRRVELLDIELSLVPLYDGAPQFMDVVEYVAARGFHLLDVEPVFLDPVDSSTLQMNGVFGRRA
jgi:FkbM family methyltransferase